MTVLYWIAGSLALGLFIYLLVALLNPEAFE
jgi:K+-transporting ATPase KdpF subunit